MSVLPYNEIKYKERKEEFKRYKAKVKQLTEKVAHLVPGNEKRKWREWDLDHKIPIRLAFNANIPAEITASLPNLQIISHKENIRKGMKLIFPLSILGTNGTIQIKRRKYNRPDYMERFNHEPISKNNGISGCDY